ncbi:hypothetical protein CB1_002145002 [Camelus ferus]|nr:hypothetical protein CB1_002145002 [Camelus ferus]
MAPLCSLLALGPQSFTQLDAPDYPEHHPGPGTTVSSPDGMSSSLTDDGNSKPVHCSCSSENTLKLWKGMNQVLTEQLTEPEKPCEMEKAMHGRMDPRRPGRLEDAGGATSITGKPLPV